MEKDCSYVEQRWEGHNQDDKIFHRITSTSTRSNIPKSNKRKISTNTHILRLVATRYQQGDSSFYDSSFGNSADTVRDQSDGLLSHKSFATMFTLIRCLLAYVECIRTLHPTLPTTPPMILLLSALYADSTNRLAQTKFLSKLGVVFVASYPFLKRLCAWNKFHGFGN